MVLLPGREIGLAMAGIGADAEWAAEMVEDDRGVGEGARQVGQLGDLRVIAPAFETERARRKFGEAGAKIIAQIELRRRIRAAVRHVLVRVPGGLLAYAAEAPAAGRDLCVQHIAGAGAQRQVRGPDNAGGDPGLAI